MIESIITILLIGFISGFVFSMPIAGPISILITSNALKGNKRFCIRTALGATIVEFVFVLVAVYGMTIIFSAYSSIIPYLLIIGALFLFFVGVKVFSSKIKLEDLTESEHDTNGVSSEDKGGLRAGLIINLSNPSLFFGILASSFLVLSFASSIGLNTGGLDLLLQENVTSIQEITGDSLKNIDSAFVKSHQLSEDAEHNSYTLLLSVVYAFSLASGGFVWLYILMFLLIKYRTVIKISLLNLIIRGLSIVLFGISFYLLWTAINIVISQISS
ncbi:MAG: LysE family transporter [Bacteroidetes bacterium]|nr:LysE family transporter [Bacteroidota bacterium]MBU1117265.1 LysE family transporter [Bacteroidota bacterium]MBU1800071.1 LysE family transporter [Bacteroidota bacterium]